MKQNNLQGFFVGRNSRKVVSTIDWLKHKNDGTKSIRWTSMRKNDLQEIIQIRADKVKTKKGKNEPILHF